MKKSSKFILTAALVTSLAGCSTVNAPLHVQSVYPASVTNDILKNYFEAGDYAKLRKEYETTNIATRKDEIADKITLELLRVHMKEYSDFTNTFSESRAIKNTTLKSGALALTSLATIFTPVQTKTGLAASSSFLTGANEIHENENFGGKTVDTIITAMEALRIPVLLQIEKEVAKSNTNLYQCERLLVQYEEQASINKAIAYLSQIAGKEKDTQQKLFSKSATSNFR